MSSLGNLCGSVTHVTHVLRHPRPAPHDVWGSSDRTGAIFIRSDRGTFNWHSSRHFTVGDLIHLKDLFNVIIGKLKLNVLLN